MHTSIKIVDRFKMAMRCTSPKKKKKKKSAIIARVPLHLEIHAIWSGLCDVANFTTVLEFVTGGE